MSTEAATAFSLKSWEEQPYREVEGGAKFTKTSAAYTYEGEIEGESAIEYLMFYREDGMGSFVGLERVVGRIGDRQGSFVLQHSGTFEPVQGRCFVVPGSGTGQLERLRGESEYLLEGQGPYPITLRFEIA